MIRLSAANEAYSLAATVTPERFAVSCEPAQRFSQSLRRLCRVLGDEAANPLWEEALSSARAARWRAGSEAVPFDSPASGARLAFDVFAVASNRIAALVDTRAARALETLTLAAAGYVTENNRALSAAVLACLADGDPADTCVVTTNGRSAAAVTQWLAGCGWDVAVLKPLDFMNSRHWDLAVLIGPSDWFPSRLFTCPRSNVLTLVHHAHVRDSARVDGVFGAFATTSFIVAIRGEQGNLRELDVEGGELDDSAKEQVPQPMWSSLVRRAAQADSSAEALVRARLLALAGGYGLWLPTDATTIRGLDVTAPHGERIVNLRAASVTPDSIIIVRETDSMMATLAAMADQALGDFAARYRRLQDEWKGLLRSEVARVGVAQLDKLLRAKGLRTANVRYWASDDNIRPLYDSDFALLLQHLGIEDAGPYLAAGRALWGAHIRAGVRLTDAIEAIVEEASLAELEATGRQQLHLDDPAVTTTLTAFRVLAVDRDEHDVSVGATRRPFPVEGAQWLE